MNPPTSSSLSAWLHEARAVVHLAAPLALSHLSYMAILLTDVVMMGWIGTGAIAAGTLARDFIWVLGACAVGLLTGATPIMARHLGGHRTRRIRPVVRNAAWLAVLLAVPVCAAAWFSSPILVLLGQDPQVSDDGQPYLRYLLWGLLPWLWFAVLTEFLAAQEAPGEPGEQTENQAGDGADGDRHGGDRDGDPPTPDDPAQDVAPLAVRAQDEAWREGRRKALGILYHFIGSVWADPRRGDGDQDRGEQDDRADHRRRVGHSLGRAGHRDPRGRVGTGRPGCSGNFGADSTTMSPR